MKKETKTTYQYSDYRGSEMIWSTEDIESIAENLDITYPDINNANTFLTFEDYERILNDTFKNYGDEIMEELRGYFELQTYNHAKAKKKKIKEINIFRLMNLFYKSLNKQLKLNN